MKLMWPPIMEFWHILSVHIICPCDLDLWPIYTKLDHVTRIQSWRYVLIWSLQTYAFLKYSIIKCRFRGPLLGNHCCHGNHFVPHSLGDHPHVSPRYELDRTTQYWVIAIFNLIRYVTLWHWPFATWVINPCTKFELDLTYHSRVMTTTIFHWPPA